VVPAIVDLPESGHAGQRDRDCQCNGQHTGNHDDTATDEIPRPDSGSIVINPAPQYRSKQNGNWGDFTTWQVNSGSGLWTRPAPNAHE